MEANRIRNGAPLFGWLSAALISAPLFVAAWAFGGMRGDVLRAVMPPVLLVGLCTTLLLPQRRPGETAGEACRRVWGAILLDRFAWAAAGLLVYLCLPLFNVGTDPLLDSAAGAAGAQGDPRRVFLPFCVDGTEHAGVLCWFASALVAALGVRHGLTRHGKRGLYEALVWNAALLAGFGFLQIVTGARAPFWGDVTRPVHFFSVFAYPNMAGAYFTFGYALALGLWIFRIEDVENVSLLEEQGARAPAHPGLHAHYPALLCALLFCAVLATRCRAAMLLTFVLTALFIVYVVCRPLTGDGPVRARRFRTIVTVGALMLALVGGVYVYAPPEVAQELRTLNAFSVSDRVTGKGGYHTRVATAVMRDYPLFGVGGWGYRHFSMGYLAREGSEKFLQVSGGANVHNDYLQFLAEHGVVGFGLMVLCLGLLLKPVYQVWSRLSKLAYGRARSNMAGSSLTVFSIPAPVLWSFLGFVAVLVHAFGDCPLRAASVLILLYVVPAIAQGFLVAEKTVD